MSAQEYETAYELMNRAGKTDSVVCRGCGGFVLSTEAHDQFHSALEEQALEHKGLRMRGQIGGIVEKEEELVVIPTNRPLAEMREDPDHDWVSAYQKERSKKPDSKKAEAKQKTNL
jgi:hypothetical protein